MQTFAHLFQKVVVERVKRFFIYKSSGIFSIKPSVNEMLRGLSSDFSYYLMQHMVVYFSKALYVVCIATAGTTSL